MSVPEGYKTSFTSGEENAVVPSPNDPMAVARKFVVERHTGEGGELLLRHHRNSFHRYVGDHYPEDDERRVQSDLWHWLESAAYWKVGKDGSSELVPFQPNKYKIANVLEALKAIGHIAEAVQPPVWLEGSRTRPINVGEIVPVRNGILIFSTRKLYAHTPTLFEQHVLPFDYEPDAAAPARWLTFLDELWGDDEESQKALAEWFGYVLSSDTSQQKMYLLVGPKRSGKGTIARVLTGLLGPHNTAAPTLAALTQNFGLQPLIGKPLAVVSDARLGSRANNEIAVERLLSISGEDTLTIDRKYRDPWTGRLPTRFMILTNEVPRFTDASGALASRFIVLVMTKSFFGEEDPGLTDALLAEAPGIFNWCLDGLDRLNARGYFEMPELSNAALQRLQDLASPVGAFVRDRCQVGPAYEVDKDDLFAAWKDWCVGEGKERAGTKAVFYRDLNAAYPGLTESKLRADGSRQRIYRGIGLRSGETVSWTPDHPGPDDAGPGSGPGSPQADNGQSRRSEGVVQDGPGSSALYDPRSVSTVRDTLAAHDGNAFAAAFELNAIGLEPPSGRPIDPGLLRAVLKVRDGAGGGYWWVECGTCECGWQVPHYAESGG
jgi:putative DNA primase/helicase